MAGREDDKKPKDLKDELQAIQDKDTLIEFESKHRAEIMSGPRDTQIVLDDKWKELTGLYYFQPITVKQEAVTSGRKRIDPKGQRYRTLREFEQIEWQAVKVKTRKDKTETFFTISGLLVGGRRRNIRQNLRKDNLAPIFAENGEKIAQQIITAYKDGKGASDGVIKIATAAEVEGYWEVIFSPQQSKDDPVDVVLQWEGHCLQIQRNKEVIVPGTYLEVADNGRFPVYIQDPERSREGRKIEGFVQYYPYSVLREATEEEYLERKQAGDEITRKTRREMQ